jgi:hypothetical protein
MDSTLNTSAPKRLWTATLFELKAALIAFFDGQTTPRQRSRLPPWPRRGLNWMML